MPVNNVLLIIADDWSPIAGCYGDLIVHTPHIDRLARQSMVFDRAFCTTPSCAASRANILTGQYSHTHGQYGHCQGIHGFRTLPSMKTLPEVLKRTPVTSALAGKTHFAPDESYPFDFRRELMKPELAKFSNQHLSDAVEDCLDTIGSNPFFLLTASGYPHRIGGDFDPNFATREFSEIDRSYDPDSIPIPEYLPDTPDVRRDLCEYYQYITRFDDFVGKTLSALEQKDRLQETLVILLSDHGMPFPGAKASSFEAGHNCPLIISHPDTKVGSHTQALVNWCDILPTILEALCVPQEQWPENLPGRSLLPIFQNPHAKEWLEPVAYSHSFHEIVNYFPYRALRGPRYKYIRNLAYQSPLPLPTDLFDSPAYRAIQSTGGSPERTQERLLNHDREGFYDLDEDPFEKQNLINNPDLQDLIESYRQQLSELRRDTNDPWLEIDFQEGDLPNRHNDMELESEKSLIR